MRTNGLIVVLIVSLAYTGLAQNKPGRRGLGAPGDDAQMRPKMMQRGPGGGQMDVMKLLNNDMLMEKAGLAESQVTELKDLAYETQKTRIKMQAEKDLAELELKRLLDQESPDEEQVMKAVENVGQADIAMTKSKISAQLRARKVIGPELLEEIKSKMAEHAKSMIEQKMMERRSMMEEQMHDRPMMKERLKERFKHRDFNPDKAPLR